MPRSSHRTLINMGRKAGLQTSELYNALAGRRPASGEVTSKGGDSNGFTSEVDAAGRPVYVPTPTRPNF